MRGSKYASPDGIDWRDPDMPISVKLKNPNRYEYWESERMQRVMQRRMEMSLAIDWRDDPTYNMRRKK